MQKQIKKDYLVSGHGACPGCGGCLAFKLVLRVLGKDIVGVIPACCATIIHGVAPYTCTPEIVIFHTAFAAAASTASGIKAAFDIQGRDVTVFVFAGDGGTFDIGLQALSGAAERGDDIIYICYDNEIYGNTGAQRSGSTSKCALTTTTPGGKVTGKKDMPEIVAAHGASYVATASVGNPQDLMKKVEKARGMKGFRYIQICAPCTSGWKFPPEKTVEIARLAYQTGLYPLYEISNRGKNYTLNMPTDTSKLKSVEEYVMLQGRFSTLTEEQIDDMQRGAICAIERIKHLEVINP